MFEAEGSIKGPTQLKNRLQLHYSLLERRKQNLNRDIFNRFKITFKRKRQTIVELRFAKKKSSFVVRKARGKQIRINRSGGGKLGDKNLFMFF